MKRIIIALTIAALVLGFSACNEKTDKPENKPDTIPENVTPDSTEPDTLPSNTPSIEEPIEDMEDMIDPDKNDYAEDGIIDDDGVENGVISEEDGAGNDTENSIGNDITDSDNASQNTEQQHKSMG